MGDYEGKAQDMVKKAEKKLNSFSFFGGDKYGDAAELLEKAANHFKLAKKWYDAGQTFEKLAVVYLKQNEKLQAAPAYVEASKSYAKATPPSSDGVRCLHKAIEYYTECGRLGMAARNLRDVGEAQEKAGQKAEAIEFYTQAAELFAGEDSNSEANKCRLKVAQFSAEFGTPAGYSRAIEIFEDIARTSADNHLLRFSAKGYLLNAGICRLCVGDEVAIQSALERYEDISPDFMSSREQNLLKTLAEACSMRDTEAFTNAIAEYDSLSRLDPWKTNLLLKVKKGIIEAEEQDEEDLT